MEELHKIVAQSNDVFQDMGFPSWPQINYQPGTSNCVVPNQTNLSMNQVPQSPIIASLCTKAERKRKVDQEYRARNKKKKEETQRDLEVLKEENGSLKKENASLKGDNTLMNQNLRDQANEIGGLRAHLFQLKHELEKQKVLTQAFSELLAGPEKKALQLEIEMLKDQNATLRKIANLESSLTQVAEENAELRTENKLLKVHNDALCGKIISNNEKKLEQGTLN